ncbi:MAG: hypothetical protein ACE5DZ_01030 [Mariprofundus sp.]
MANIAIARQRIDGFKFILETPIDDTPYYVEMITLGKSPVSDRLALRLFLHNNIGAHI